MLNYYEIGQRIRKIRKARKLSQEELAEKIDISTTHMSHIETGNTKLSLPVLVDISLALDVSLDELVFGNQNTGSIKTMDEIAGTLDSCNVKEKKMLAEIIKSVKYIIDQYQ